MWLLIISESYILSHFRNIIGLVFYISTNKCSTVRMIDDRENPVQCFLNVSYISDTLGTITFNIKCYERFFLKRKYSKNGCFKKVLQSNINFKSIKRLQINL